MLTIYFSADGGLQISLWLRREQFLDWTVAWQSPSDIAGTLKQQSLKLFAMN